MNAKHNLMTSILINRFIHILPRSYHVVKMFLFRVALSTWNVLFYRLDFCPSSETPGQLSGECSGHDLRVRSHLSSLLSGESA